MVEQQTFNLRVVGSIPTGDTLSWCNGSTEAFEAFSLSSSLGERTCIKRGTVEINSQLEEIKSNLSLHDDIEFDENLLWPKPLVCIKSFPRSGTTYIKQNLVLNNFIVIKKKWDVEHNANQPLPITILRNPRDCVASNIAMLDLRRLSESDISNLVVGQIKKYDIFLNSLISDIDNRIPYTFSQLENNPKEVLESINEMHSVDKASTFVFANKIPVKRYVINYNTDKVDLFLPSSKNEKSYNDVLSMFDNLVHLFKVNDTFLMAEDAVLNRQKYLQINI